MSKKSKPGDGSHGKGKKGESQFEILEYDNGNGFVGRIVSFFKGLF